MHPSTGSSYNYLQKRISMKALPIFALLVGILTFAAGRTIKNSNAESGGTFFS